MITTLFEDLQLWFEISNYYACLAWISVGLKTCSLYHEKLFIQKFNVISSKVLNNFLQPLAEAVSLSISMNARLCDTSQIVAKQALDHKHKQTDKLLEYLLKIVESRGERSTYLQFWLITVQKKRPNIFNIFTLDINVKVSILQIVKHCDNLWKSGRLPIMLEIALKKNIKDYSSFVVCAYFQSLKRCWKFLLSNSSQPFNLQPLFQKSVEKWFKKSGSRNLV